jgi:branched-chain amino acid transport system ATP-binding protein
MLEVKGIDVYYDGVQALKDVSLRVAAGKITAIVGSNGAGKSTLLKVLSGQLHAKRGRMLVAGKEAGDKNPVGMVKMGVSLVPEGRQLFTSLKVVDNLLLGAYLLHNRKNRAEIERRLAQVYRLFPRLEERAQQTAGALSGGEQQMVSIGRALMIRPKLLMLDEPSMGLAPLVIRDILAAIVELNQQGAAILLVEQNARAALGICHYAYVLETGAVARQGRGAELLRDARVIADYLGA